MNSLAVPAASTQLTPTRSLGVLPSLEDWRLMLGMADELVKSGLLPTWIKTPAAALAVITKGRELGIAPMYALSAISMIQGRPTANAELMAALVYRDHGDAALAVIETTAERCTVSYKRRGWPEARRQQFTYTVQDAQLAGLTNKENWKTYPGPMLRARCISAVARMGFPDTLGGLYSPEEMGAEVDPETGELVSGWGNPERAAPAAPPTEPVQATGQRRHAVAPPPVEATAAPWDDGDSEPAELPPLVAPSASAPPREWYDYLAAVANRAGIHAEALADNAPDEDVIALAVKLRAQLVERGVVRVRGGRR